MGGNESVEVTAGIWGFLVLFGLALACWFLFRSMTAHLRKMTFQQREQVSENTRTAGARSEESPVTPEDDDPIGSARH